MVKGLIIKSISGEYDVAIENQVYTCKPRGVFRYQEKNVKVGDYVEIDIDTKTILKVLPRKNDLVRPVIANVDKAFLVFSVKEPDLNLNLLDRLICIMEFNNIESIIVFSKIDLLPEEEKENYNVIKDYYSSIGYKVYEVEKEKNDENILQEFKDSICVLAGQSGVGKSSILNRIDETLLLKTNEISQALGRGRHTTRHVELHKVADGYLADAPGFGIVDFTDFDELTLSQTFIEFFNKSDNCKFSKCLHINEPKCFIKEEVENGKILKSRYENYLLFNKEVEKNLRNRY